MNCFYHTNRAAIGNCVYCGKGLCADCYDERDEKLYCLDKHISEDGDTNDDELYLVTTEKKRYFPEIFLIIVGAIMLYFGIQETEILNSSFVIGAAFIGLAVVKMIYTKIVK